MKRMISIRAKLFWLTAALALSSCATTPQHALVCPQCKTVALPIDEPYYVGNRPSWFGRSSALVYKHECPNCSGAIKTFAADGRLAHKCSICDRSPFSCPVLHPPPARLTASANAGE